MQNQNKKYGVCCYICCKEDLNGATREYFKNLFVGSFLTVNWLLWSSIGKPPKTGAAIPNTALVFKAIGFIFNLAVMITTLVVFCKWKHDWNKHARGIHLYGKVFFIGLWFQLLLLIGLMNLTSIAIAKAADKDEGVNSLGAFFLIARLVLIGCFCIVIWSLYMTFKLMKLYSEEAVEARRGSSRSLQSGTTNEEGVQFGNRNGDRQKDVRVQMDDSMDVDQTQNNNPVMVERDLNRMTDQPGEVKKESQFNQVEVNPANQ